MSSTTVSASRELKRIHRLQSDRHFRDSQQLFFVEGAGNFLRAIASGYQIVSILRSRQLLKTTAVKEQVRVCQHRGVRVVDVSPEAFRSVSVMQRVSGIAAVIRQRRCRLSEYSPTTCCVVVSQIKSAGNFGTLVRSAAASGADDIVLIG